MAKQKSSLTVDQAGENTLAQNGADAFDLPSSAPMLDTADASEQAGDPDEENPTGETPYDPPPAPRRVSAYAVALGQLERVSNYMNLEEDMRLYLRTCQRELIVH
ncbi:MAG TPA: hypothetical protein PL187_14170, partial [Caldilinea sp.]|nr:hypothetical protein [Caldilinea sp.]